MYNTQEFKEGYNAALSDLDDLIDEVCGISDRDIYCKYLISDLIGMLEKKLVDRLK